MFTKIATIVGIAFASQAKGSDFRSKKPDWWPEVFYENYEVSMTGFFWDATTHELKPFYDVQVTDYVDSDGNRKLTSQEFKDPKYGKLHQFIY